MDTDKPIVVDVDLGFGDLYKATLRISVYVLRYLVGAVALLVLLYGISLIVGSGRTSWGISADALAQWLYPVLVGAVPTTIVMIPLMAFLRARMFLRAAGGDGKRRYSFSRDVVKIESRLANAEVKWPAFLQVRESRNCFLMYSAPGLANILPKRFFPDRASMEEFRSLVRANVRRAKLQG
jgi:hypothetical protein